MKNGAICVCFGDGQGAWRDVVETIRAEVMDGGLLKDCLELGSGDLRGMIQILKDLALNFHSSFGRRNEL